MTAPAIGDNGDLFGPYPATAQEREDRVASVFGAQGPLRRVTMRASRYRCPGCRAAAGEQCGMQRPGGGRRRRRLCHPSRAAVTHPCAEHGAAAGVECPESADYSMTGICAAREKAATEDLRVLALAQRLLSDQRADQERVEAERARPSA